MEGAAGGQRYFRMLMIRRKDVRGNASPRGGMEVTWVANVARDGAGAVLPSNAVHPDFAVTTELSPSRSPLFLGLSGPLSTTPRSKSSPSPPPSRPPPSARLDSLRGTANVRVGRRPRLGSFGVSGAMQPSPSVDWSTSYQAGSSSSASGPSSEDDSDDSDGAGTVVSGRRSSYHEASGSTNGLKRSSTLTLRSASPRRPILDADDLKRRGTKPARRSFTRSRSPAPPTNGSGYPARTPSPSAYFRSKQTAASDSRHVLPAEMSFSFRVLMTHISFKFAMDVKYAGECLLLLFALCFVSGKLVAIDPNNASTAWLSIEIGLLALASLIYIIRIHITSSTIPAVSSPISPPAIPLRPASPSLREQKRSALPPPSIPRKDNFGYVWMTVPKNYRTSTDDGLLSGVILGPLIASSLLYSSLKTANTTTDSIPLPPFWYIEPPLTLPNSGNPLTALEALVASRRNAVHLATLCGTLTLIHVCASWWFEARYRRRRAVVEGERGSVPRSEARRAWYYVAFTFTVTASLLALRYLFQELSIGIWQNMTYFDIAVASTFYQFTLYSAIRLAHRGFTLGELGLTAFGATALYMELVNLTIARIWPLSTPYIKTYRLPTPLLIFQIALIPGSFMTGFLLSPVLVLSRHIAQRPVRRLRFPQEKETHRRALAAGFYLGALLIVGGLIGMWTRWCLQSRDPWLWVIYWLFEGRSKWTRVALLAYWGSLATISIWGWNRQLARSRRFRIRGPTGLSESFVPQPTENGAAAPSEPSSPPTTPLPPPTSAMGLTFPTVTMPHLPNLPNFPNGANFGAALGASEWLDAADKRVPTLGLNARRKFFHAEAVLMFLPGIAADPAFTHLSFSAAFALFTFAEYVRYFALYPFGASVHLFMNEFLDHKDSGTAILSHFYLLTGCAGALWFEGPSRLLQYSGVLAVGVGDAMASVVGKRFGRHKWSPTTSKTVEGSAAFTTSVVAVAWMLRLCGLTEDFSMVRYAVIIGMSSVLEGLSVQNDNLTLPVYMWSVLTIGDL